MMTRTAKASPNAKRAKITGDQKVSAPAEKASASRLSGLYSRSACYALFVTHIVHVDGRVTLKLAQAVNGAEIERFRMIIMAGSGISNTDFHFADWIDRHGSPPYSMDSGNAKKDCSKNFQQLANGSELFLKSRAE
jgi:hypothetical protein